MNEIHVIYLLKRKRTYLKSSSLNFHREKKCSKRRYFANIEYTDFTNVIPPVFVFTLNVVLHLMGNVSPRNMHDCITDLRGKFESQIYSFTVKFYNFWSGKPQTFNISQVHDKKKVLKSSSRVVCVLSVVKPVKSEHLASAEVFILHRCSTNERLTLELTRN